MTDDSSTAEPIHVLGAGAIGFPLAACLADAGRSVLAVRTSRDDVARRTVEVAVRGPSTTVTAPVEAVSLARLDRLDGTLVVTAKSHANEAIARRLEEKGASGPVVLLQNGLGVERPFLERDFSPVYRGVLYFTSQAAGDHAFTVRPVAPSPVGVVEGDGAGLGRIVEKLTTDGFPFRPEPDIRREAWKKAIVNAVFNSVCPLLEVDNGVFARDGEAAGLARELVRECATLADRLELGLDEDELMEGILRISRASDGQLISTLQDLRRGRPTEIEFLNLEMARVAASLEPPLRLPATELLGRMILAKSARARREDG